MANIAKRSTFGRSYGADDEEYRKIINRILGEEKTRSAGATLPSGALAISGANGTSDGRDKGAGEVGGYLGMSNVWDEYHDEYGDTNRNLYPDDKTREADDVLTILGERTGGLPSSYAVGEAKDALGYDPDSGSSDLMHTQYDASDEDEDYRYIFSDAARGIKPAEQATDAASDPENGEKNSPGAANGDRNAANLYALYPQHRVTSSAEWDDLSALYGEGNLLNWGLRDAGDEKKQYTDREAYDQLEDLATVYSVYESGDDEVTRFAQQAIADGRMTEEQFGKWFNSSPITKGLREKFAGNTAETVPAKVKAVNPPVRYDDEEAYSFLEELAVLYGVDDAEDDTVLNEAKYAIESGLITEEQFNRWYMSSELTRALRQERGRERLGIRDYTTIPAGVLPSQYISGKRIEDEKFINQKRRYI